MVEEQAWERFPVVVVDDAHRLDEASAALIHHLAATESAFILATVRADHRAPEAVTALWKDGLGRRLGIAFFNRTSTPQLLRSLVAGTPAPISEAHLWHASGGNALYLCELVRTACDNGEIRSEDGLWRWTGELGSSTRLAELVMRRLHGQSDEVRQLMDLVAFAEPLRVATLEAAGCSVGLIEFAEEAGLLRSQSANGTTEVRLGHPLYGEVARSLSTPLAQARMALTLLGAGRFIDDPERIVRLALWQLGSAGVCDPQILREGALRAQAALDLVIAERLARGSSDTGGGAESALFLGRILVLRGQSREAEDLLSALVEPANPRRTSRTCPQYDRGGPQQPSGIRSCASEGNCHHGVNPWP